MPSGKIFRPIFQTLIVMIVFEAGHDYDSYRFWDSHERREQRSPTKARMNYVSSF